MREALKYIIVLARGCELPIVFSCVLDHADIAKDQNVLAAGFVYLDVTPDKITASCHGKSITLKKSSRPEDARLIEKEINRC